MTSTVRPCGAWDSVIDSSMLTTTGVGLGQIAVDGGDVYWTESRPLEGGRVVVIRNGDDAIPSGFNARTRAHEYGGGAYTVHTGAVFFSHFADQRLYRQDRNQTPYPITPEPPAPGSLRYADARLSPGGRTVVCVRERHEPDREAINELVAIPADGAGETHVLAQGRDFYSSPRISPDARRLLWLSWDHPNMPWDGTELWLADIHETGPLSNARRLAGGPSESVFQPEWSSDGIVHYVSDKTGWWNLYSEAGPLAAMEAEFGLPQWVFGMSQYGFLNSGRIACIYSRNGLDYLAILDAKAGSLETLPLPYTSLSSLQTDGQHRIFLIAAAPAVAPQIVAVDARDKSPRSLKSSMNVTLDSEELSTPEPIEYPTARGRTAHALYYPPRNKTHIGPPGEKPPLLILSHGGPTASADSGLRLPLQYGVGDLEALARDTHKFESRYLDKLVGPYPDAADLYRERSPIHFASRMSCPVILFQGLDDKVVPPSQAETFVAALRARGLMCEYVSFPGEGHGFRKAETIKRVVEAELEFYARVFAP